MKKMTLLSRAEMRKVIGGNPVIQGCEVTCTTWIIEDIHAPWTPGGVRVLAESCSYDHQQAACTLSTPVPGSCGNCTIDNDEW